MRKSGRIKSAEVLFSTIPVASLSADAQLDWYVEAGEIFQRTGRLDKSIQALREALALDATYQRHLGLSMLSHKGKYYVQADQSVDLALAYKPDDIVALRHKAYILAAKGENERAVAYLERVNGRRPRDYETLNSLGLLYMRLGRYAASTKAFHQAIDAVEKPDECDRVIPAERLEKLKSVQNQMAELNRRFHCSLSQSVQVGENANRAQGVQRIDNAFNQALGVAEVAYRPPYIGYRAGRITEIFANALWTHDDSDAAENEFSSQGRLGV